MKIIALEGLDKCGKFTQTKLLYERMKYEGFICEKSEFHRYDTPTGDLIRKFLYNEYDADKYTIELIMAADKQMQQNWFKKLKKQKTDFLILDRYTTSQIVYGLANGIKIEWIRSLQKYLTKPSLEIFIDIPVEKSMSRKGKNTTDDKYETNKELLTKVRENYHCVFSNRSNGFIVDGMMSIEEIHESIWLLIKSFYKF